MQARFTDTNPAPCPGQEIPSRSEDNSMAIIEVKDLRKSYGTQTAVDGLTLQVAHGETLGLLGPNGAGKTTTIGMLIGLLDPSSGSVTINGAPPDLPTTRKTIGLAPQSLSLYEELTARENLQFFGRLYDLHGAALQERVAWALDFAGLTDRGHDRVSRYSGGMKRRLNLACAMIHEPQVVLMDEPTVGVDPQSRNHVFECIERLQQGGLTILYTTHYMNEAQRLCDRVAIMDQGKLLALDSVENLIRHYGGHSLILAELREPLGAGVQLPGQIHDRTWRRESDQPMLDISQATRQGVEFQSLTVTQPDLESVFLALTGRSLRD